MPSPSSVVAAVIVLDHEAGLRQCIEQIDRVSVDAIAFVQLLGKPFRSAHEPPRGVLTTVHRALCAGGDRSHAFNGRADSSSGG